MDHSELRSVARAMVAHDVARDVIRGDLPFAQYLAEPKIISGIQVDFGCQASAELSASAGFRVLKRELNE